MARSWEQYARNASKLREDAGSGEADAYVCGAEEGEGKASVNLRERNETGKILNGRCSRDHRRCRKRYRGFLGRPFADRDPVAATWSRRALWRPLTRNAFRR